MTIYKSDSWFLRYLLWIVVFTLARFTNCSYALICSSVCVLPASIDALQPLVCGEANNPNCGDHVVLCCFSQLRRQGVCQLESPEWARWLTPRYLPSLLWLLMGPETLQHSQWHITEFFRATSQHCSLQSPTPRAALPRGNTTGGLALRNQIWIPTIPNTLKTAS